MAQLRHRISFYHDLAVMLDAGLSLDHALRQHFPGRFDRTAGQLRRAVQSGSQFHEAMMASGEFSEFECNIIAVGESGGSLPASLRSLDSWFSQKRQLRRKVLNGLLLPVFLYVGANLILAALDLFLKKSCPARLLLQLGAALVLPLLAVLLFRLLLAFSRRNMIAGYLIEPIPILGSLQHKLETSRFFQALGISLSSGIPVIRSIRIAAHCCRNQFYVRRYLKLIPMIQDEKESFSSAFSRIQNRRDTYSPIPALISTGEVSGQLDEFCTRIGNLLHDEAGQLLGRIAGVVPHIFYLAVLAFIAWKILTIFSGYIQQLNAL